MASPFKPATGWICYTKGKLCFNLFQTELSHLGAHVSHLTMKDGNSWNCTLPLIKSTCDSKCGKNAVI